jgi:multisubunit Na+/H+ antiporter MnhB subunit
MTASLIFDIAAALLIVAIGGRIIIARDITRAVIGFIVYGLLLTIVWVRLSAVDVALTEAAIGSGLTGMLLINAAGRLRSARPVNRVGLSMRLVVASLCVLLSASLAVVVVVLPVPAPTLAPLAVENLQQTGLGNPVAAVLFAYRALDTLLEKVVLLLALLSVWSLAADDIWPGVPDLHTPALPGSTLGFFARHLPPFGIIVGLYMCWIGANEPGGAFQGGTVIAAMWLLVMVAGIRRVPSIGQRRLRLSLVTGPAIFVAIGLAGIATAGSFLAYPPDHAKLLIVTIELALTLSIAAVLGLLAAGSPIRERRL